MAYCFANRSLPDRGLVVLGVRQAHGVQFCDVRVVQHVVDVPALPARPH